MMSIVSFHTLLSSVFTAFRLRGSQILIVQSSEPETNVWLPRRVHRIEFTKPVCPFNFRILCDNGTSQIETVLSVAHEYTVEPSVEK